MTSIKARKGSANIFKDLGFLETEAEEALAKSELISAIAATIKLRKLTHWLTALGRNVEIRIGKRVDIRGGHIAVQAA
ncbi:MAG: helix-turn-helix domain-containing protein [Rhodospirillales bacterium]|nr:helix-turn-helix domain-containing protein [Rhodospirillales bacterium]